MASGRFFHYVMYKHVLLKDTRLGGLYYLLVVMILLFTVVEIFFQKGYLQFDMKPQGTVKVVLSDEFSNKSFTPSDLPYCRGDIPCRYTDPWDLNWPIESRAVAIMTFAKDRIQQLKSNTNSPLDEYEITEEKIYFTQGPEYVVLKVDHAVVATQFTSSQGKETLAASHRNIRGFLYDVDGDVIRELSPERGKPDKVSLKELMEAAGLETLDLPSDAVKAKGRSFREQGLILKVTIFYQNWFTTRFGTSDIEYAYHVRRVPYVEYNMKQVQPLLSQEEILANPASQAKWRLLRKRYSIRVEFEQAGSLGMPSVSTLLLKLVSGMGLLTLTATIIDNLALYILPDKEEYKKLVYEESEEFRTKKVSQRDKERKEE